MTRVCPRCGASNRESRLPLCPGCLLASEPGNDEAFPEIPGLIIEEELARGGMGRVIRGRHTGLGRDVAVKLLSPDVASDPEFRARFEREARTLAQLDHPNIVRVHDFGSTPEGEFFLVMELVSGGTLADVLPLPTARAFDVLVELCAAVAHAHERGVVHRDIKPRNVLIGPDGRVKLTDFGIARLLTAAGEPPVTRSSVVLGTPSYMAPEAATGAKPDPKMDVYSLGVLLHEIVTGQLPSDDSTRAPALVAGIVRRATALDPKARTPSVRALASDVESSRHLLATEQWASEELPPDERAWIAVVALLMAVATALALYAFVISFTPRVIVSDDALPLIAFGVDPVEGGRVLTRARFDFWPVLGAALGIAVALGAQGLLRRHWRENGLDAPNPDRRLPGARRVLRFGVVLFALAVVREALSQSRFAGVVSYIPVLGGVLELWMLQVFWSAVLDAWRTRRRLAREPSLWAGLCLSLLPPTYHFFAQF